LRDSIKHKRIYTIHDGYHVESGPGLTINDSGG
jgi:hypothetical protein